MVSFFYVADNLSLQAIFKNLKGSSTACGAMANSDRIFFGGHQKFFTQQPLRRTLRLNNTIVK